VSAIASGLASSLGESSGTALGSDLRAAGDRVLLVRVHDRGKLIAHVHETLGIDDRVMQFGEVVGLGHGPDVDNLRWEGLELGDIVVYPSPRVFDHFSHHFDGKGTRKVIVLPGYWVSAIVKGTFIAEHPELREYGTPLE
jgi:hypothetical protein